LGDALRDAAGDALRPPSGKIKETIQILDA
jgi:hypothetical protein